jgi:hypothetical protein
MKAVILSIVVILFSSACSIPTEPQPVCVKSHTIIQLMPVTVMIGSTFSIQFQPMPATICDVYFTPSPIPSGEQ